MLLLAVAALAAAPQSGTAQLPPKSPICQRTSSYATGAGGVYRGKPQTPQELTELPDANFYLSVFRRIDGCEVPIVVKYRVNRR